MRPSPGQVVGGKYRIVRVIGDGGMGVVFEARHEVLGSAVALKFLHTELASRPGLAARFLQEARVCASIQSPHVTRVIDVDQTPDGSPYLVMELLAGESLQQILDRQLKLPRDQTVDFGLQILAGLEAAHALGVVHRDLKPDNVFVTPSPGGPLLKLLDFGIAKLRQADEYQRGLTRPGVVMGTPEYMAPEQLYAAERVDHRADIYSLGAMLYEILSGARPADGDDATAIIAQVLQGHVKPLAEREPELPPGLTALVHRALAVEPEQRFTNATEMRLMLARFAGSLSYAGRLAATPVPGGVIADEAAGSSRAGEEPGSLAARGVAPTLPPEEPPELAPTDPLAPAKGSTQDVPGDELQRRIATAALAAQAAAPLAPYPVLGLHRMAGGPIDAPPRRRVRRRALTAGMVLFGGFALIGTAIAVVVLLRDAASGEAPPLPGLGASPAVTLSAQPMSEGPGAPPLAPPPAVAGGGVSSPPRPKSGGTAAPPPGSDAGTPFPFPLPSTLPPLPSTLPSTLPPLPSTLPPLPSGLPPFLPFPTAP